jgi:photosystem II stability/assembly factor-like uncharacterized protein
MMSGKKGMMWKIALLLLIAFGLFFAWNRYLVHSIDEQGVRWKNLAQIKDASIKSPRALRLVSVQGDFLATNDGGVSWQKIDREKFGEFYSISFFDENLGWASTKQGEVLGTSDGGAHWTPLAKPANEESLMGAGEIRFADKLNGWIINPYSLLVTRDGGKTWLQTAPPAGGQGNVFHGLFMNSSVGWLSGTSGAFFSTTDGGKHWQEQTVCTKDMDLGQMCFINSQTGWISSHPKSLLYRTDDGGLTWKLLSILDQKIMIRNVHFINKDEGWLAGSSQPYKVADTLQRHPILMHSTDGGNQWEEIKVEAAEQPLFDRVHFLDAKNGWLFSRDKVFRTTDGGRSWTVTLNLPPITG